MVEIEINDSGESNYYDEDVSVAICGVCGTGLGYLTWWPVV